MPCNLEPILLDTARRYHKYHATIHWKHESGWSVGIGWSISNRACTHSALLAHMDPPRTCLCSSWVCRLSFLSFFSLFYCSQNSERINTRLIWVFRELVYFLITSFFSSGERKTCEHTDCMINHKSRSDELTSICCSAFRALSNSCPHATIMPSAVE